MPSSNDLVLEQVRELIEDRRKELIEGIAPRALSKRLDDHSAASERRHQALEDRIRALEKSQAYEDGRFQIPPVTIPRIDVKSKGPASIGPWMKVAARSPVVQWSLIILLVAVGQLLGRCGIAAPPAPQPSPAVSH